MSAAWEVRRAVTDRDTIDRDCALGKRLQAVNAFDKRALPEPEGPQITTTSPLAMVIEQLLRTLSSVRTTC